MNSDEGVKEATSTWESAAGTIAEPRVASDWKKDLIRILLSRNGLITLGILALAVAARVGLNWYEHRGQATGIPTVKVVNVEVRPLSRNLELPGNAEAIEQASLYSHVTGYLKKLYCDEGDHVKKDQLLATIDAPDAVQAYEKAKADYALKDVTLKRYAELLKGQVISEQEYDTVEADANESKAKLDNALATLSYTNIRAPFSGAIARRFKYEGDLISAAVHGSTDQTPIFILVNEGVLRFAVSVPQVDVANISVGHPAAIRVDTLPNKIFRGSVTRIDQLLDDATKTQRVLVDLPNPKDELHAGMFATVDLQIAHKDRAIMVPREAVVQKGEKRYVYALSSEDHVREIPVETGYGNVNSVEVLQGLKPTDVVALPGGTSMTDGMQIHPMQKEAEIIPNPEETLPPAGGEASSGGASTSAAPTGKADGGAAAKAAPTGTGGATPTGSAAKAPTSDKM